MGKNSKSKRDAKNKAKVAKDKRRKALLPLAINVRPCGDCTECCSVFGVNEIDKQPWVKCENQVEQGCAVYADRPKMCREFYCLWQHGLLPIAAQPNSLGAIFAPTNGPTEFTGKPEIQAYETRPGAFDTKPVIEAAKILSMGKKLVIGHTFGGKKFKFVGPPEKIAKAKAWFEKSGQ